MSPGERRDATRLGLGVLPSLIGFGALLTPLLGVPEIGLGILIAGYLATVATEARLSKRALVPGGYMSLRWGLSVVVLILLTVVLIFRLIGVKIIF
jgi:hypothetical protein